MSPKKVFLKFISVMVTKFVIITSSLGIIISARRSVKARCLPLNSRRAKANAASTITMSIISVVATVNMSVLRRYFKSGTAVKAV